mgnify:FL=1
MRILPLVSTFNKSESTNSFAIIEALFLIPLFVFLSSFLLSKMGLASEFRMAIVAFCEIVLAGVYARFASS